ncbi:hypothetical protein D3C87_1576390 [compost metagenome]
MGSAVDDFPDIKFAFVLALEFAEDATFEDELKLELVLVLDEVDVGAPPAVLIPSPKVKSPPSPDNICASKL